MNLTLERVNSVGGIVAAVVAIPGAVIAAILWLTGINADVARLEDGQATILETQARILEKLDAADQRWADTISAMNQRIDGTNGRVDRVHERVDENMQAVYATVAEHDQGD